MSKLDKHLFSYYKFNNKQLFNSFHSNKQLDVFNTQCYIPIHKLFFNLSESNYNNVVLDNNLFLKNIYTIQEDLDEYKEMPDMLEFENLCVFDADILNTQTNKKNMQEVFIKYSPLIDPITLIKDSKFDKVNLRYLPQLVTPAENIEDEAYLKLNSVTNTSYVDGLFTFLSSLLLKKYNAINCLQYYGSFLTIKRDFSINVYNDLDFLSELDYFNFLIKNKKLKLEAFEDADMEYKQKKPLLINDELNIDITSICDNDTQHKLTSTNLNIFKHSNKINKLNNIEMLDLQKQDNKFEDFEDFDDFDDLESAERLSNCSNNSSRYSHTTEGTAEQYQQECLARRQLNTIDNDNDSFYCSTCFSYDDEDDYIGLTFPEFPVQLIFMEHCENTLSNLLFDYKDHNFVDYNSKTGDELLEEDMISSEDEIISILMQVVMTLLIYKKAFKFSHNDLHASNIMYVKTQKKYINYLYNGVNYIVPTYGKIFKIIDFGRATYSINGHEIVGSSFEPFNQAHTQFNYSTCYDSSKPELKPNYSFDLCRLASELYSIFIKDDGFITEEELKNPLIRLINTWVTDDYGKNIIYKRNGKERHEDFKMYKMISRCVSSHTPEEQLNNDVFKVFIDKDKKNINKKNSYLVDIDAIPELHGKMVMK